MRRAKHVYTQEMLDRADREAQRIYERLTGRIYGLPPLRILESSAPKPASKNQLKPARSRASE